MNRIYENALEKSVREKGIRKDVFRQGEVKGLKKGLLIGSIATVVVTGLGTMGYKGLTTKVVNPSYTAGFEAVHNNSYGNIDPKTGMPNGTWWVDYNGVVREYDPEKMDFDSFLYGAYCDFPADTRNDNMDGIMHQMSQSNYTDYGSFYEYCDSKGFTELEDGTIKVDNNKYRKGIRDYMKEYNQMVKKEEKIDEFKRGKL